MLTIGHLGEGYPGTYVLVLQLFSKSEIKSEFENKCSTTVWELHKELIGWPKSPCGCFLS